eukprot:g16564.t1
MEFGPSEGRSFSAGMLIRWRQAGALCQGGAKSFAGAGLVAVGVQKLPPGALKQPLLQKKGGAGGGWSSPRGAAERSDRRQLQVSSKDPLRPFRGLAFRRDSAKASTDQEQEDDQRPPVDDPDSARFHALHADFVRRWNEPKREDTGLISAQQGSALTAAGVGGNVGASPGAEPRPSTTRRGFCCSTPRRPPSKEWAWLRRGQMKALRPVPSCAEDWRKIRMSRKSVGEEDETLWRKAEKDSPVYARWLYSEMEFSTMLLTVNLNFSAFLYQCPPLAVFYVIALRRFIVWGQSADAVVVVQQVSGDGELRQELLPQALLLPRHPDFAP